MADNPSVTPIGILPKYQTGAGKQHSAKGSRAGSTYAPSQHGGDDVDMNINEEEEKKEVAVQQFGDLGSNKNLGKRPSSTPLDELLQETVPQGEKEVSINRIKVPQAKRANTVVAASPKLSAKSLKSIP